MNSTDNKIPDNPRKSVRKRTADLKAVISVLNGDGEDFENDNSSMIYQPNEELIQATTRVKTQRDLIVSRLKKMDESKTRVSKIVFEKVYRDYSMQLKSITQLLDEKKTLLKKELKNLYLLFEKKTLELNRHREILEEAQFRHFLEEFSEEQFKEVQEYETREISTLQNELSQIQAYIRLHEELFDAGDLSLASSSPKKPEQEIPQTHEVAAITKTILPEKASAPQIPTHEPVNISETVIRPQAEPEKTPVQIEPPTNVEVLLKPEQAPPYEQKEDRLSQTHDDIMTKAFLDDDLPLSESNYFEPEELSSPKVEATPEDFSEKTPTTVRAFPQPSEPKEAEVSLLDDLSFDSEPSQTHSHVSAADSEPARSPTPPPAPVVPPTALGSAEYKLVFVDTEGPLDIHEFVIKDNVSIGRSPSNDLVLKAPKVSRQHAAINKYKDQYLIIDLKSSNGVFINGRKTDEHTLQEGDEISIGGYKMIFQKNA